MGMFRLSILWPWEVWIHLGVGKWRSIDFRVGSPILKTSKHPGGEWNPEQDKQPQVFIWRMILGRFRHTICHCYWEERGVRPKVILQETNKWDKFLTLLLCILNWFGTVLPSNHNATTLGSRVVEFSQLCIFPAKRKTTIFSYTQPWPPKNKNKQQSPRNSRMALKTIKHIRHVICQVLLHWDFVKSSFQAWLDATVWQTRCHQYPSFLKMLSEPDELLSYMIHRE